MYVIDLKHQALSRINHFLKNVIYQQMYFAGIYSYLPLVGLLKAVKLSVSSTPKSNIIPFPSLLFIPIYLSNQIVWLSSNSFQP